MKTTEINGTTEVGRVTTIVTNNIRITDTTVLIEYQIHNIKNKKQLGRSVVFKTSFRFTSAAGSAIRQIRGFSLKYIMNYLSKIHRYYRRNNKMNKFSGVV